MRSRRRYLFTAALLGILLGALPAVASSETSPIIEAVNEGGLYGEQHHHWNPSAVTVAVGNEVAISNPTAVNHGIEWVGGPPAPNCTSGVPVGTTAAASGANWSGACKFTQPGTYTFYCTVHHAEMTGTITVKPPGTPTVATDPPTGATQFGVTFGGAVNPEGQVASYHFEWGANNVSEHTTTVKSAGSDFTSHVVSETLKGLLPGTEYHVELVATYGASSTVLGGERIFTTLPVGPPGASTGSATGLMQTGATLNGAVSSGGLETTYHFEYGLAAGKYEHVTPTEKLGPEDFSQTVFAPAKELLPATVYHFRLVAEQETGPAVEGVDHTFTTAAPPGPEPSPTEPPPTPTLPTTPPSGFTPLAQTSTAKTGEAPKSAETPVFGPLLVGGSVKLAAPRHGSAVHGSLELGQGGAGGRLEIDLLAKGVLPGRSRGSGSKSVRVGRLLRQSLSAGKVTFSLVLTAQGKHALTQRHSLPVTVKLIFTPTRGAVVTVTRTITLRA